MHALYVCLFRAVFKYVLSLQRLIGMLNTACSVFQNNINTLE